MNLNPLQEIEELRQAVEHLPEKLKADLLRLVADTISMALKAKADEIERGG